MKQTGFSGQVHARIMDLTSRTELHSRQPPSPREPGPERSCFTSASRDRKIWEEVAPRDRVFRRSTFAAMQTMAERQTSRSGQRRAGGWVPRSGRY